METQTLFEEIQSFRSRCFFKRKRCHLRKKAQQIFNQKTRKTRAQKGAQDDSELEGKWLKSRNVSLKVFAVSTNRTNHSSATMWRELTLKLGLECPTHYFIAS